jgi:hypothetical protein
MAENFKRRPKRLLLRRIKGHRSGFYWEPHDEIVTLARAGGRTVVMQRSREMVTEIQSLERNPDKVTLLRFADVEGRRGEVFVYRSALEKSNQMENLRFQIALSEGLISMERREITRLIFKIFNILHPKRKISKILAD